MANTHFPGKVGRVKLLGNVGNAGKLRVRFMKSIGFQQYKVSLNYTAFVNYCTAFDVILCTIDDRINRETMSMSVGGYGAKIVESGGLGEGNNTHSIMVVALAR